MAINLKKRTYVNKKNGKRKEYWVVTISLHHTCGRRQRKRFNRPGNWSETRAKSWAQKREAHLLAAGFESEDAESSAPEAITFSTFAAKFVVDYPRLAGLRPSTTYRYVTHVKKHYNPMFGDRLISDIGEEEYRMLASLDRAPKTRNGFLSELRCMLARAYEWGLRPTPPPNPRRVKEPVVEPGWYSPAEYEALVAAAPALLHRAILLLGGDAGLRCGEMMGLRARDVEFASNELHVCRSVWKGIPGPTKGGRDRRVPLSRRLSEGLHPFCVGLHPDNYVLSRGPEPMTRSQITHRMRIVEGARLGLSGEGMKGRVHRLRHTFGSNLVRAGVNPRVIQKLMGHSSIKMTERYMGVADDQLQTAIESLEALSTERSANMPRAKPRRKKDK